MRGKAIFPGILVARLTYPVLSHILLSGTRMPVASPRFRSTRLKLNQRTVFPVLPVRLGGFTYGRQCGTFTDTLRPHRKYESGAVGSMTHVVALQGTNYSCELEVYADGYSLK